jgi:hypothetical protein
MRRKEMHIGFWYGNEALTYHFKNEEKYGRKT